MMRNLLFLALLLNAAWCFSSDSPQVMCATFCASDKNKCQGLANANGPLFASQPQQGFFGKQNHGIQEDKSTAPPYQEWQSSRKSAIAELQNKCEYSYSQCMNSCRRE
jgi:hypothetical protein